MATLRSFLRPGLALHTLLLAAGLGFAASSSLAQTTPAAPPESGKSVVVTVISTGQEPDQIAAAYDGAITKAQIQQDLAAIAAAVGVSPPKVKVSTQDGIAAGEANFSGLANWQTGEIHLAALAKAYQRFGKVRAVFLFGGPFPVKPITELAEPRATVRTQSGGSALLYDILLGEPGSAGTGSGDASKSAPGRRGNLAVQILMVVLAALAAGGIVYYVLTRRSNPAARPESP